LRCLRVKAVKTPQPVLGKPDSRYEGRRGEIIYVLSPNICEGVSALAIHEEAVSYFGCAV